MQRPYNEFIMHIPEFRIQTWHGRKKDSNGNPVTKKGDKHPNIINGYVAWETVQLADLAQTKKLFPYGQNHTLSGFTGCCSACTNYYG